MVLGVPNRLTCMQGQKTRSLSYNMHLFLFLYLLNDSQTIHSKIHFSKPLLCVMLICGDWCDWLISFKTVFVSAVLLCVQPLPGKQLFLPLQKRDLVAKNEFAFSFRPTPKALCQCKNQVFLGLRVQQVGGQYANVSC